MAVKPKNEGHEREQQIDAFLEMLRKHAGNFRWRIDQRLGLRAVCSEVSRLLCPIAAVWYAMTGAAVDNAAVYDVADKDLGLKFASLDITIAADERLDSPLGQRLKLAVGMK